MMNQKWIMMIGIAALMAGIAVAVAGLVKPDDTEVTGGVIRVEKKAEADFPALAKLPFEQAVQKALSAVQGKVLKAKLEDENGFLVYSVDVVTADKAIVDVKVDAGSGKVLAIHRH